MSDRQIAGNRQGAAVSASWFGSSVLPRGSARVRRALIHVIVGLGARIYFDISYGLLARSVAGRRLMALEAAGGGPVHGYLTSEDRDALHADLDPAPGDQLLDLGCGIGGIAIEVHRRSGAEILGVDVSPQAVSAAGSRARRAGVDASVGFLVGDLRRPPRIGATSAYAIDSLMFVPDLVGALRGIGGVLGSDGRLFATLLVFGSGAEPRLQQAIQAAGGAVERLENVTPALADRSHARAGAAVAMLRRGTTSLRGRLAMRLVIAEERLIQALVARGRVSRWRFLVRYGATPQRVETGT
jgi:SAM-dependent methyltransferase